jgi:uncharacterized protein
MLAERISASQLAEMSAQSAGLSDSLRPADLPRLSGVVASDVAGEPVAVAVGFGLGPERRPVMRIQARGTLHLVCQRCLGPVSWPLDVDVSLTVVADDGQAADLADPFDSVLLEEGELPVRRAVEDEILAVLPLSPLHTEPSACGKAPRDAGRDGQEVPRPNRPFAGLADLMGQGGRSSEQD